MNIEGTILRQTCTSLDSRRMIQLIRSYIWYFKYAFNTWIHAYWNIFRHCRLYLVLVELFNSFYSTSTKINFFFWMTPKSKKEVYHLCSADKQVSLWLWCTDVLVQRGPKQRNPDPLAVWLHAAGGDSMVTVEWKDFIN